MNYAGTFDFGLFGGSGGADGSEAGTVSSMPSLAAGSLAGNSAIIVEDARLLFSGDYARRGSDLVLSKDGQDHVISDYFKGALRKALSSPDGATLSPDLVKALVGEVQVAQAGGAQNAAAQVIGTVSKLAGSATAIRNGVSVTLNVGDNVQKGDVVQAGADSSLTMTFIDGTVFGLSANARMVLNEMVYDPQGSSNSSLLSLIQGTITFVAGETAKNGDMRVDTPVATMGIRGTAVLVEIGFEVPGQGTAPPVRFQVLVEPNGRTGSYVLYNKNTGAIMGTVNQAGLVTAINGGGDVNVGTAEPLTAMAQAIIQQTLQQYFPSYVPGANPRSGGSGNGSTPSDPNSGTSPDPIKFAPPVEFPIGIPTPVPINFPGSSGQPPVEVIVTRLNTAPIVTVAGVVLTLPENSDGFDIGDRVTIDDPDAGDVATPYVPGSARIVSATGPSGTPSALNLKSLISIDPETGRVSYDPSLFKFLGAGQKATYVIEFESRSGPDTTKQTLTFTVDGTNDGPVVSVALTGAVSQDDAIQSFDLLAGASDPDLGETATLSIGNVKYSLNGSPAQSGAPNGVTLNGTSLKVDPTAFAYLGEGQTATLVVTYSIIDAHGASITQTETITITGVNDQPEVISTNFIVTPGDTVTLDETSFTIADPDASSNYTFTVSNVSGGYFVVGSPEGRMMLRVKADGSVTFTMDDLRSGRVTFVSDGSGPPSFTLVVDDGSGAGNSSSVPTQQSPIYDDSNRAPTVEEPLTLDATEGMKPVSHDLLTGAADRDGDTLSIANLRYTVGGQPANKPAGITINGTTVSVDPSDPSFNYLKAGQTLTIVITFDIIDGNGGSVKQTETITITGTNDAPTVTSASFLLKEGGTTLLKAADFGVDDPDSQSFTFTASQVKHGKFQVLGSDGNWHDANSFTSADLAGNKVRFIHDGSEHDASFKITASDGDGGISNGYVAKIGIEHVNDAPTMLASPMIIAEGGTVLMTVLNFLAVDPDDNSFTFHVSNVQHGMFRLWDGHRWIDNVTEFTTADLKSGRVVFTHDGSEAPPSYTVYADDGHGDNSTSKPVDADVLFIPVNDKPTITHASFTVEPHGTAMLKASDFGVSDPDSSSFRFTVSGVQGGHFETLNYNYRTGCWEWSTDNSFTTSELNADRVRFVHDGGEIKYDIRADDGSALNGRSDKFHGGGTVDDNHDPAIVTSHLSTSPGTNGTVLNGLAVTDIDGGDSFHFSATAVSHGHVYFTGDHNGTGTAGSLAELNEILSHGVLYQPPSLLSGQETVTINITDNKGGSDTVNFVFHVGNVSAADSVALTGAGGKDILVSTAAKDTMIGGAGADQFVFGPGTGHDTISDFVSGTDKIDLQTDIFLGLNEHSFAEWLHNHTSETAEGTTIHLDNGGNDSNTIYLSGVHNVQASDFIVHNQFIHAHPLNV